MPLLLALRAAREHHDTATESIDYCIAVAVTYDLGGRKAMWRMITDHTNEVVETRKWFMARKLKVVAPIPS